MRLSIKHSDLSSYVCRQLNNFFPDDEAKVDKAFMSAVDSALSSVEHSFKNINNKYYFDGVDVLFNHRNSDQFCVFLYWLSRATALDFERVDVAEKVYLLNKALNGIDAFYEVQLPAIFAVVHPLGTVLGRAEYKDFLLVYQRCGVGTNKGRQPRLGRYLTLHPGASVLGDSNIGDFCSVGADSLVLDCDLPNGATFVGGPKASNILKRLDPEPFWRFRDQGI